MDPPASEVKAEPVPAKDEAETRPFLASPLARQRSPRKAQHGQLMSAFQTDLDTAKESASLSLATVLRWPGAWLKHAKNRTSVLVNLSAIMERTDEQILPAVYLFVAASFSASPKQLGYLTLCRALVQALASPLGGFLGAPLLNSFPKPI